MFADSGYNHSTIITVDGVWFSRLPNSKKPGFIEFNDCRGVICFGDSTLLLDEDYYLWAVYAPRALNDKYSSIPEKIPDLPPIKQGSGYYDHVVILDFDGNVYVTGYNNHGQLGLGNTDKRTSFIKLENLPFIQQVETGFTHTYLLDIDGNVWGCGWNSENQVAEYQTDIITPTIIKGLPEIISVASGRTCGIFLDVDGKIWFKGKCNCDDNRLESLQPIIIYDDEPIKEIYAFQYRMYIKDYNTKVYAMGSNTNGALGIGNTLITKENYKIFKPVLVDNIISIAPGKTHTIFIDNEGSIWTCGNKYSNFIEQKKDENGTVKDIYIPLKTDIPTAILPIIKAKSARSVI